MEAPLWLDSLALADPYYVLPVLTSAIMPGVPEADRTTILYYIYIHLLYICIRLYTHMTHISDSLNFFIFLFMKKTKKIKEGTL